MDQRVKDWLVAWYEQQYRRFTAPGAIKLQFSSLHF